MDLGSTILLSGNLGAGPAFHPSEVVVFIGVSIFIIALIYLMLE